MTRTILMRFAKPSINITEHIDEIQEAIKKANRNLYGRYNLWISDLEIFDRFIAIYLTSPDEVVIKQPGRRLRGISQYLLKQYPDYSDYLVGTRLFNYTDITDLT